MTNHLRFFNHLTSYQDKFILSTVEMKVSLGDGDVLGIFWEGVGWSGDGGRASLRGAPPVAVANRVTPKGACALDERL